MIKPKNRKIDFLGGRDLDSKQKNKRIEIRAVEKSNINANPENSPEKKKLQ